jgi:hypothetical protein
LVAGLFQSLSRLDSAEHFALVLDLAGKKKQVINPLPPRKIDNLIYLPVLAPYNEFVWLLARDKLRKRLSNI